VISTDDQTVLIGRAAELEAIDVLLDSTRQRGGAMIVRGEPGIGKSVLVAAASRRASARGMRVLRATGVRSEANVPFAGLHQLLRPILGDLDDLPAGQREVVLAAFGVTDAAAPDRFRIALAALDLLAECAARRPLLLVAEDAHWLDRATADVLAFVARRLEADPIAMLVAMRDQGQRSFDDAGLSELRLQGLDDESAAALLDARAPELDGALRGRLLTEAAGNPLALVELPVALRELAEPAQAEWLPLTARLEHAFAARFAELPVATRTAVLVAALNDGDALTETLAAASALNDSDVSIEDIAAGIDARLVSVDDRGISFRHPLVRSAIHQAATLPERHRAHAALAQVLTDPDRRVWHRAAATVGPDDALADELDAAAERALRRGALGSAATALEKAARFTQPGHEAPRLLRAAALALELGRREAVTRLVRQAERLELSPLDLGRLAWIRETLVPGIDGDPAMVLSLVECAELVAKHGDPDLALNLLWAAAQNSFWADRSDETHDEIVAAVERMPIDADDPRILAVLANAAPLSDVQAVAEQLRRRLPDPAAGAEPMQLLGSAAFALGMHDLAAGFLDASIDTMREQGRLVQLAQSLVMQAWSQIHLGRWTAAAPAAEEGARLAHETSQPIWEAGGHVARAMLAGLRGDERVAEELAAAAEPVVVPAGGRAVIAVIQLTRGVTALGAGRYEDAYIQLKRMLDPADLAHHRMTFSWAIGNLAEAALKIGERDAAREVVARFEPVAARTASPVFRQAMRHARALLAKDDEAQPLFERALGPEMAGGPFERARLQLAFGVWLRRHRRVAESRTPLRAARDTFDALGAGPWSDRARLELRATGETSRRRAPDLLEQLTPQELQVAQMAAEGLSNREIGHKLYLSHRTVGSHLYRIFPKLRITSRSELASALASYEAAA
jgi:DNA-binding CsgD family transcriptional regulator